VDYRSRPTRFQRPL